MDKKLILINKISLLSTVEVSSLFYIKNTCNLYYNNIYYIYI